MYVTLALEQLKPCRDMGFSRFFRLLKKSASSPYCRRRTIPPLLIHKTSFYPCRAIIPRAFFSANADIRTAKATDPKLGFVGNGTQKLKSHKTEHTAFQHLDEEEENDVSEETGGAGFDFKVEIEHPWAEWITLMEHLVKNNYFESLTSSDEEKEGSSTADMLKDFNRVKTACLNFGRDRFDILRSLSREDIKAVVEYGCLNTNRKVVNSGKRLRAYVNLDEQVVCGICNLRDSCDRADIKPQQEDGTGMDDIMRVLLTYGLQPLVGSAESELHMRETVIASVRKLLKEVVELSATPLDPNLPRPMTKQPPPRIKQSPPLPMKRLGITDIRMKKGDWLCPRCNIIIFASKAACILCNAKRPKGGLNPGEWECPACDFINFSRNTTCLKCNCKRPKDDHMQNARQGRNDSQADAVSDFQQSQMLQNPGDWECSVCKFKNFRRNMTCLKCDCKRPKDELTHNSRQVERSSFSKPTGEKSSFKNFGDLDEDDDDDDPFGSEDDQPQASRSKLKNFGDLDEDDDDDDLFGSEDDQPQASRSKLKGEKARSSGRGERRTQKKSEGSIFRFSSEREGGK